MEKYIRNEYPRPSMVRHTWMDLNGYWDFDFDDENIGLKNHWELNHQYNRKINVPFAFQTKASGIFDRSFHDYMWYHRKFKIDENLDHKRVILHFQAVDYQCKLFINGKFVGEHRGGQCSFSFDISEYLSDGEQNLTLFVEDSSTDVYMPRGKQYWKEKPEFIYYDRTSGIWQSVWIEIVNENYIKDIKIIPQYDEGKVMFDINTSNEDGIVNLTILDQNKVIAQKDINIKNGQAFADFIIFKNENDFENKSWSPENPYLFDVVAKVDNDEVTTYFGLRKVHTKDGKVFLNNKPYYLKLVLDQGYWEDSLLTPLSAEALKKDILLSKEMGFNGARKHQKAEDPYFAYYADKLGYLVWGEMASSIEFNEVSAERDLNEWKQILKRDYNHPSIIAWVPLNESWGVPNIATDKRQQQHSLDLYNYIKSVDNTRLVISNDGWEMTITDICAIHNYRHGNSDDIEQQKWYENALSCKEELLVSNPADKNIYADGYHHRGEPIILTEFGGIGYVVNGQGWGYTAVNDEKTFINEYKRILKAVKASKDLAGFCYTQFCDVEQEINGLLTYDRKAKVNLKTIKEINDSVHY